jgi:hypothetical protein
LTHRGPFDSDLYGDAEVRFAFYGLVIALVIFLVTGGHVLFLPLLFVLPLGGLFGHRRRYGSWYGRRW